MLLLPFHATQANPLRIVIADDMPFFIDGFLSFINKHPHIQLVGTASNGEELLQVVQQHQPKVVLTSIDLPGMAGVEATKQIANRFHDVKVIILSSSVQDVDLTNVLEAGAHGFLTRNQPADVVLNAIEKVVNGEVWYCPEAANRVLALMKRTGMNPLKPFSKPKLSSSCLFSRK